MNLRPQLNNQAVSRTMAPQKRKMPMSLAEAVALLIVIILGYWFFVRAKSAAVDTQKEALQTQQQAYNSAAADRNALLALVNKLQQSPKDVAITDEALPLTDRVTQLNYLLENLVGASGMKLNTINSQPALGVVAGNKTVMTDQFGVSRKVVTTTVDLAVTGTIDQFKNLLQLLETNGRILDVTSVDIGATQGGSFRLKLKTYSYDPQ